MGDHCPRDAWGFCWIALMDIDQCGAEGDRRGGTVRCPETREEAEGRLQAAREARLAQIKEAANA